MKSKNNVPRLTSPTLRLSWLKRSIAPGVESAIWGQRRPENLGTWIAFLAGALLATNVGFGTHSGFAQSTQSPPPTSAQTRQPVTHLLWPDGAPGALGDEAKDRPTLIEYALEPGQGNGAAVVILPGGGYGHLAMDHEGHQIARWFNSIGVSAYICNYRHRGKGYIHPAPRDDAWRAIRWVRAHSPDRGFRPDRIGVIGFSAGGHLASTVSTHFDAADPDSSAPLNRVSTRPDFAILCYPVIALGEPFTHTGSQRNLLGADPPAETVIDLSNEKQVSDETPPTFLWHTADDSVVPVENSIAYFQALRSRAIAAEMHIYETGRHGLGLARGVAGVENWTRELEAWLKRRWE